MNLILLTDDSIHPDGSQALIDNPYQVAHIKTVLQAQVGDCLKIGKLGGKMGTARIAAMTDTIALTECVMDKLPPAKLDLTVVLALPRPKVLRRVVLDMAAMGTARIIIVNSARTDKSYWQSPLLQRLFEFAQEGLMQGVDTIMPDIVLAKRFRPFVEDELAHFEGEKWVAHPYANQTINETAGLPKVLIVGAEGGFVPFEIELLQSVGVKAVSMGSRILRTESAVSALVGRWLV